MQEDGEVRITLRDVYDAVTNMGQSISELKEEVTMLADHNSLHNETAKDFEQRLRRLERWAYGIPTTFVLAALSAIATIVTRL